MISFIHKFLRLFFSIILLSLLGNPVCAQIEFSFTGLQVSFQKRILSDIPVESNAYHLTWNFYNSTRYTGELGLGAGNVKIPSQNHPWSDLNSKGLFSAHFLYTRHIKFAYFSAGIQYQKITGNVDSVIPDENSISGFDKFIQHNTYYFYEFPISVGIGFSNERFAVKAGILQSNYFGKQNYTQYLYQGLGDVVVNRDRRTFRDQDNNRFFETEFAFSFKNNYQIKLYYAFPINQNDPTAGLKNSDQNTFRLFFGSIFN